MVGWEQASYTISEAAGVATFCATLTGQTEREVIVTISTVGVSALGKLLKCQFMIVIFCTTCYSNSGLQPVNNITDVYLTEPPLLL